MGVTDDQLDSAQAAGLQPSQKRGPERPVLAVADVEAEDLRPAVGGDAGGDHDGLGHHPPVHPGLAVGRIQEDVGIALLGQRAVQERTDLLVEVGADPGDLGLGDPGVDPHGCDQVVDSSGGETPLT